MELQMANDMILGQLPPTWVLSFPACGTGDLLVASRSDRPVVIVTRYSDTLRAEIRFDAHPDEPVVLLGKALAGDAVQIVNTGNRIALYANDTLQDEDWPLGSADLGGAMCRIGNGTVRLHDDFRFDAAYRAAGPEETVRDLANWRPEGHNTSVGDCMPFVHDGIYRLFYLFDRRHHRSKWGLGAHQWAQIATTDFTTWYPCPLAIPIESQEEGSICTGSLIWHEDTCTAFYAVRMSDRSPARLTWATSTDGVHFTKSGRFVTLTDPYEPVSARDPKVFAADDGLFHMLVTSSVAGNGCLAHLVSPDLENWRQLEPFVRLDTRDQPECPDTFQFNGFTYLVYSLRGTARYFVSQNPFGPWTAPPGNQVGPADLRVPKAAILQDRLVFAGFVADGDGYGGRFALYEAKGQPDGRLTFTPLI